MELEKARSNVLSDDLLYRLDEFEQGSLSGSASDKLIVLDHTTHCHVRPFHLNVIGSSAGCAGARMMMGLGGGIAGWLDPSVWIERLAERGGRLAQ